MDFPSIRPLLIYNPYVLEYFKKDNFEIFQKVLGVENFIPV